MTFLLTLRDGRQVRAARVEFLDGDALRVTTDRPGPPLLITWADISKVSAEDVDETVCEKTPV